MTDTTNESLKHQLTDDFGATAGRIHTSGPNDEFIHVGDARFHRDEFVRAFGGTLTAGFQSAPERKFGNPAPIGLMAFSTSVFALGCILVGGLGVSQQNILIGLCFFHGGLLQVIAGIWELVVENTFGAVLLCNFGGFFLSYGTILTPAFGIAAAYDDEVQFHKAIGFFALPFAIFTFIMWTMTFKSTLAFCGLIGNVLLLVLLVAIAEFTSNAKVTKAAGVFSIVLGINGYYNAYSGIATPENAYFVPKPIYLPGTVLK